MVIPLYLHEVEGERIFIASHCKPIINAGEIMNEKKMINIKNYPDDVIEKCFTLDRKDVNVVAKFTSVGVAAPDKPKQRLPIMKATAQVQNNVTPNA